MFVAVGAFKKEFERPACQQFVLKRTLLIRKKNEPSMFKKNRHANYVKVCLSSGREKARTLSGCVTSLTLQIENETFFLNKPIFRYLYRFYDLNGLATRMRCRSENKVRFQCGTIAKT